MKRLVPLAFALTAGAAAAQPVDIPEEVDGRRVSQTIVYGNDACPPSTDEVIYVCPRLPEDERYRIPEAFRGQGQRQSQSWAAQARSLEYVGRTGIQSCSTVGPGGFTGCWEEMMRQAREERRTNGRSQPVP